MYLKHGPAIHLCNIELKLTQLKGSLAKKKKKKNVRVNYNVCYNSCYGTTIVAYFSFSDLSFFCIDSIFYGLLLSTSMESAIWYG